jgi:hypothetical protein
MTNSKARRCFLKPDWSVDFLIRKYPITRACLERWGGPINDDLRKLSVVACIDQTFAGRPYASVMRGFLAASLNNVLGGLYKAPPQPAWDLLQHDSGAAPDDFWPDTPQTVELTADGLGIAARDGLPTPYYWACNEVWCLRYAQGTGELDQLCAWNWESGHRGSQRLFPNGALRFGTGQAAHAFGQAELRPFGFDNRWGGNRQNHASLCLEGRSVLLELSGGGENWVTLDWKARNPGFTWKSLGWDGDAKAWVVYVGYLENRNAGSSFFPPFPAGLSEAEFFALENATATRREMTPDWPVAGNLYLFISGNGAEPEILDGGNLWRWSATSSLSLQIAAGTTRREAAAELARAQAGRRQAADRRRSHYAAIRQRVPTVEMPDHPNIETTVALVPLLLESLKLDGHRSLRHSAAPQGYIDTHTSLMTMRGVLYNGDLELVDRFLAFLADPGRRGPRGEIATNFFQCGGRDDGYPDWTFNDLTFLALIGQLHWHDRGGRWEKHYPAGREQLLRILDDADPETGLFRTRGYWPDHPLKDVGRVGQPWPVNEAGIWYEALRHWELLALRRSDREVAGRARATSEKLRAAFVPLFLEPEAGLLCDSVEPETRRRHLQYSLFGLHFHYGMFGHELVDDALAKRLATAAYAGFYDPSWKLFRTCLPAGDFHSPFEYIYIHWTQGLGQLFRRARHREGLRALRESFEFHLGKFVNFPESFNMKPDLTPAEHGASGWFCETLGTRYQVIVEDLCGINLAPDNLAIVPPALADDGGDLRIRRLRLGASLWNLAFHGTGRHVAGVAINGEEHAPCWVFPARLLEGGCHDVEVRLSDAAPAGPVLLEAPGLKLVEAQMAGARLTCALRGPGRAFVKFWSPAPPALTLDGQPLPALWEADSQTAVAEIMIEDERETALEAV